MYNNTRRCAVIQDFKLCSEERKHIYALENQIREDKLKQGINGVEWLVLNYVPKEHRIVGLEDWKESMREDGFLDLDKIMMDAILMNHEKFYSKYRCNWWMAISFTLTHLVLLKNRDYDQYFKFISKITFNGGN